MPRAPHSQNQVAQDFVGSIREAVVMSRVSDVRYPNGDKALTGLGRSQKLIFDGHEHIGDLFYSLGIPANGIQYEEKIDTPYDGKPVRL